MRSRILVAALICASIGLGLGASSSRKWAVVDLRQPTQIGQAVAVGPVLFVHDDAKMARGEPCTTVYRYDPAVGPLEEIVSFHCEPKRSATAGYFTLTTAPGPDPGSSLCRLKAYQFAGDSEAHGVPLVHDLPAPLP
jgi:hypothetical protein